MKRQDEGGEEGGEQEGAPALIIAGPTASGKSALAVRLAERWGGVVINADAMQLYRELPILTAQPDAAARARAPHRLYGVFSAETPADAATWRRAALAAMAEARAAGRLPILCGGTGLYLHVLQTGLAELPPIPPPLRQHLLQRLAAEGPAALHAELARLDPETAARLAPRDGQRILRALEVRLATGKGLRAWQRERTAPLQGWRFAAILLDPPRPALRAAIAARLTAQIAAGALEEVRALLARTPDPRLPLLRAHGVPELSAHLRGALRLDEALALTARHIGQYTKRQATWFRHHRLAPDIYNINARIDDETQFSESFMADLRHRLRLSG